MKLVAENSEADLRRRRAEDDVGSALRTLAANMIRVVRGAGRPWELATQANTFVHAVIAYREQVGMGPSSDELTRAVSIDRAGLSRSGLSAAEEMRIYGIEEAVRGALQIAASRLLGQRTQEAAGDSEFQRGRCEIERAHAEMKKARTKAAGPPSRRPPSVIQKPTSKSSPRKRPDK